MVSTMTDEARTLYYLRLRGEALGLASDACELAELLKRLAENPRTPIEELPLDLDGWVRARRTTMAHMRSEMLIMAGSNYPGPLARLRAFVTRRSRGSPL